MLERLSDAPDRTIGLKASGTVMAQDIEDAIAGLSADLGASAAAGSSWRSTMILTATSPACARPYKRVAGAPDAGEARGGDGRRPAQRSTNQRL